MPTTPSLILFRKTVHLGLTAQAINFAQSAFMGHRVCFNVPVDFMNEYFRWARATGEARPTGRFVADPANILYGGPVGMPRFSLLLERAFETAYTDLDGVANGLNYSSTALDATYDMKRDVANITNQTYTYSLTGAGTADVPGPGTHYSVNDLVMAFVLNKCFGSSSFDAWDVVYNLEDAFGMLTNVDLANAIEASLDAEEAKAAGVVLPAKSLATQSPGDDKGRVDEMFRSLLSIDPQRFYKSGKQIPGLFESNTDVDGSGNWCLGVGDKIEIPVRLYFRAPVTVLSVVDNVKNPSSATPDQVETTFIEGEGSNFLATNPTHLAAADRGNMMSLRLQLVCSAPVMNYPVTRSSSEEIGTTLDLQVVHKTSLVFYYGAHYPTQTAIAVVVAGGTPIYTYTMNQAPPAITIDSATGIITFDPTDPNAVPGRTENVIVTISDSALNIVQADINITVDGSAGSTPSGGSALTMPAPTSANNSAGISGSGPYFISGYTQSMVNMANADTINFNSTSIAGTWAITATVNGGSSFPVENGAVANINKIRYTPSTGELVITSQDYTLYPPGSTVVFTATCTRTSDGVVGTTVLTLAMPNVELILADTNNNMTYDGIDTYTVDDPANGSYEIDISPIPNIAGANITLTTNEAGQPAYIIFNSPSNILLTSVNYSSTGAINQEYDVNLDYIDSNNISLSQLTFTVRFLNQL